MSSLTFELSGGEAVRSNDGLGRPKLLKPQKGFTEIIAGLASNSYNFRLIFKVDDCAAREQELLLINRSNLAPWQEQWRTEWAEQKKC